MAQSQIFSIGHGNRKIGDFLNTIKSFGIRYVIDVRSQPYSKFNPHFNQTDLKYSLERNGLGYVFMGDSLGGRPQDPSCYDNEGKVDYEKVKLKDFFLKGVERLITAYN